MPQPPPPPPFSSSSSYYDILIIGAGIAGINAGYRIQTQLPHLSYAILERRDNIGGTWSFFRFPGIRSDSDLHTMGFAWEPWHAASPLARADSILSYVRGAAAKYGVDGKVRFGWDVTDLDWSDGRGCWAVRAVKVPAGGEEGEDGEGGGGEEKVVDGGDGEGERKGEGQQEELRLSARYVVLSTGFFNYRQPLPARIPGLSNFAGPVVHPQFWPEDLDYTGKRMAVVGSGATAITIVPAAAELASKVTMIQRSPSYVHSQPMKGAFDTRVKRWLPRRWSSFVLRWKYAFLAWAFFLFARRWPGRARELFLGVAKENLPEHVAWDPHFRPRYEVWDQRICVCPDGDFYEAFKSGKADVKTGVIENVEKDAVVMESGERVEADILVTATGLKLQMLGGARLSVNGKGPIDVGDRFMWRGAMVEGVPNAMLVIGYFNNSWMLGAELATQIFISTIKNAARRGMTSFTPTISAEEGKDMPVRPLWNMTSTYLQTGNQTYPKASTAAPWTMKDNYLRDWWAWKRNDLVKGMVFGRAPPSMDQKR